MISSFLKALIQRRLDSWAFRNQFVSLLTREKLKFFLENKRLIALCHGIPNMRKFKSGDYVNLDCTIYYDGVHGDNSIMVTVGDVHEDIQKLVFLFYNAKSSSFIL